MTLRYTDELIVMGFLRDIESIFMCVQSSNARINFIMSDDVMRVCLNYYHTISNCMLMHYFDKQKHKFKIIDIDYNENHKYYTLFPGKEIQNSNRYLSEPFCHIPHISSLLTNLPNKILTKNNIFFKNSQFDGIMCYSETKYPTILFYESSYAYSNRNKNIKYRKLQSNCELRTLCDRFLFCGAKHGIIGIQTNSFNMFQLKFAHIQSESFAFNPLPISRKPNYNDWSTSVYLPNYESIFSVAFHKNSKKWECLMFDLNENKLRSVSNFEENIFAEQGNSLKCSLYNYYDKIYLLARCGLIKQYDITKNKWITCIDKRKNKNEYVRKIFGQQYWSRKQYQPVLWMNSPNILYCTRGIRNSDPYHYRAPICNAIDLQLKTKNHKVLNVSNYNLDIPKKYQYENIFVSNY